MRPGLPALRNQGLPPPNPDLPLLLKNQPFWKPGPHSCTSRPPHCLAPLLALGRLPGEGPPGFHCSRHLQGQSPCPQSLVLCRALLPAGPLPSELCAFSVTAPEPSLSQSWDLWTCHLTGGVMMDSQGAQGPHKQKTFCYGGWRGAGDLRRLLLAGCEDGVSMLTGI